MNYTTIDTLRLSARLKKEGLAAEQADAFARALGDELGRRPAREPDPDTRPDLEDPVKRARLTTEIRMFKWVFGFAILATLTAFVALFESLDRIHVQQSRNGALMATVDTRLVERLDAADQKMAARLVAADEKMATRLDAADEKMVDRLVAADKKMDERFSAADAQMKDRFSAADKKMDERFSAADVRMKDRSKAVDVRMDERFNAVDVRMDERFDAVDKQFELLGQRIGNVEALVRELIAMQRGKTAAGAGATVGGPLAGGQVRAGPAARAPEGVMR